MCVVGGTGHQAEKCVPARPTACSLFESCSSAMGCIARVVCWCDALSTGNVSASVFARHTYRLTPRVLGGCVSCSAVPCGSAGGRSSGAGRGGAPLRRSSTKRSFERFVICICLYSRCCYCTMLTFLFCVLLLIPPAMSVCQVCFGEAASVGCTGDMSTCPWVTGISENAKVVTAILAGTVTSSVISIGKLPSVFACALSPKRTP